MWSLLLALELGFLAAAPTPSPDEDCRPSATFKSSVLSDAEYILRTSGYQLSECIAMCCETEGCSGVTYRGFITSSEPLCDLVRCWDCEAEASDDSSGLLSVLFHPQPPTSPSPPTSTTTTPLRELPQPSLNQSGNRTGRSEVSAGGWASACVPLSLLALLCLLLILCGLLNLALVASTVARRRREAAKDAASPPSQPHSAFSTHLRAYDNLHLDVDTQRPLSSSHPSPMPSGHFHNVSTIS